MTSSDEAFPAFSGYTFRMRHPFISRCSFVLFLVSSAFGSSVRRQEIISAPHGPFRIDHSQIIDSTGQPFLMRGTQLVDFHPPTAVFDNHAGRNYGVHSATSFTAVRLRFNMNTVRLPLDVDEASDPRFFPALEKVVRRANQTDLLVILAAREPGANLPSEKTAVFWRRCAAVFKDYPNVIFDAFSDPFPAAVPSGVDPHSTAGWETWRLSMTKMVDAIRSTGAAQPIVLMSWNDDRMFEGASDSLPVDDATIIYEVSPRYATTTTEAQREARFGYLARRLPVTATGWDLELDDPADCATVPADPAAASAMILANLEDLDARGISWTMSLLKPGKLIDNLEFHDATTLEDGWTCGAQKRSTRFQAGLGRVIEGYLRATEERSMFVVSAGGGVDLPRGGFADAYGPVLAERDAKAHGRKLPTSLAGIRVEITDSAGISRLAGIYWVAGGWGQVNFVVPEASAPGRGQMTLLRNDGSRLSTNITIADTSPGFRTGTSCAGPAEGEAIQSFSNGRTSTTPMVSCKWWYCSTLVVPVSADSTTKVRLMAVGFRHAASAKDIVVTVAGKRVQVLSYGPTEDPGMDQVTIAIPKSMRGLGETDLIAHLNGRIANVVRIRIGG